MKSLHALVLGLAVLMASASICLGAEDGDQVSTLMVSGTGTASDKPDIVTVVLGVETSDQSAAKAVEENAQLMNTAIEALKTEGVKEEDIRTSRFDIYPVRDWIDGDRSEVVEFDVTNQVSFTMNLTGQIGEEVDLGQLLDAAIKAGANTVDSVTFGFDDPVPVQEAALEEAVANAMDKAEVIAEAAGVKLGRILEITESEYSPLPQESRVYLAEAPAAATPIVPGEVEITASVYVTYEITE
jgi:uncharacterized protein YggE